MTSSQWLDFAVLAVAFIAAVSGWRSGALGSLLSFVGVVLGAVAGFMSSGSRATLRIYEYNDAVSKYETRISFWASERPEGDHCYAMHLW